jgi:hypothetical protein
MSRLILKVVFLKLKNNSKASLKTATAMLKKETG